MKKYLFFISVFFIFQNYVIAQEFITTWMIGHSSNSINFEANTTGAVNYTWETTSSSTVSSGSGSFQGPNVTISGLPAETMITLFIEPQNLKSFKYIFQAFINPYTLVEINQWGAVEWETLEDSFKNTGNILSFIVSATDFPNLSNCSSLKNMFQGNANLNSPFNINFWDVSNVTDLSGMFQGCFNFNQALSQWDTSNVTNMSSMFEGATFFNQNIGNWNTANVTDMNKMFKNAYAFDRNINNWNTSNVTDMSEMFSGDINSGFQSQFNKNIGSWNTSNVLDMSGMFSGAVNFNQNIGNWNTSNVTNMSRMFRFALAFNQNIGNWDTSNVTDMSEMFKRETLFFATDLPEGSEFNNGGIPSIENWNTANVVDMTDMFAQATSFNHNLQNWSLNEDVVLVGMLNEAGLDCNNYSLTLIGWNNNSETPNNKILGATFLEYGPEALSAINNLVLNKGWGFSGHDILSTIPEFSIDNVVCENEEVSPLPTTSDDGISGTWTPEFNFTETTTYNFTPNDGECAVETTFTVTIEPNIQPTFESVPAICEGETLPALPTLSLNGISGIWSPTLNNTQTTTYTFTPNEGQCAEIATLTINVNTVESPEGEPLQTLASNSTLSDILISPNTVVWYASLEDALANTNQLPSNTELEDETVYYAVNDDGLCRSEPFAVTVFITLNIPTNEFVSLKYYPNPVEGDLYISNFELIKRIQIFNLLGQIMIDKKYNQTDISINLNNLPASTYIVKLETENQSTNFQIIKR